MPAIKILSFVSTIILQEDTSLALLKNKPYHFRSTFPGHKVGHSHPPFLKPKLPNRGHTSQGQPSLIMKLATAITKFLAKGFHQRPFHLRSTFCDHELGYS